MRYELKVIYLEDEAIHAYELRNLDTDTYFEWTVSNTKATRFLLTDNGLIIKVSYIDKKYIIEIVKGTEKVSNIKMENSKLNFECDTEYMYIVYDYYNMPDLKHEIIGNIMGIFLIENEGGFFENESDYEELEDQIGAVLEKYNLLDSTKETKKVVKSSKPKKVEDNKTEEKEVKTEEEAVIEEIEEPAKKTRKSRKKVVKEDK